MRCACATRLGPLSAAFLLLFLLAPSAVDAVRIRDADPVSVPVRTEDGYYATVGVGFINIDQRGVGARVPMGVKYASVRWRLIASVHALDLAFLEGDERDQRYFRPFVNSTLCVDGQTGFRVPSYRCSGGTDLIGAASADLAYVVANEVWIGPQPGRLFAGLGYRHRNPSTLYGTLGFFFDQPGRTAGGFKLMVGEGFVAMGLSWAFDLRRLL